MQEQILSSLNGRVTSISVFVKTKTVRALSSNHWSSTENNSNNSWNVNFNNGNTNNNNKYNSNVGRAVSALGEKELITWIEAADDCCRQKKVSQQCTNYRIRQEDLLILLALAVKDRSYEPLTSECFVVTRPKLREIFAAHFIDRIVQHWIVLRIEPLLEQLFVSIGDVSYNCRKGYGTLRAVQQMADNTNRITQGYTKDAWIGRFDVRSFFMSIEKELLWTMLRQFILTHYHQEDKETLLWLAEKTVKHRPQDNCIRKGNIKLWNELPKHKSLFYTNGTAIGNITSQILANFFLSPLDEWAYVFCRENNGWYGRFVDDMVIVLPNKQDVLAFHRKARSYLEQELQLSLHPDKVYIQHATKGVKFVGSVIKPFRIYLSNRTVGRMWDTFHAAEGVCHSLVQKPLTYKALAELEHYISACNSYMGFLCHHSSYALRRKLLQNLKYIWHIVTANKKMLKLKVRRAYTLEKWAQNKCIINNNNLN